MASNSYPPNEARSSASASPSTFKFPAFQPDVLPPHQETTIDIGIPVRSPSPLKNGENGFPPGDRWYPRKEKTARWGNGSAVGGTRHGRQKSLSEAIRTIKGRRASISQNAHEIADALKAPISAKLIVLCGIWYTTSILSNTSSKAILTAFPKPVTLTLIQFGFVSTWCIVLAWLAKIFPRLKVIIPALKHGIRPPSKDLILTTMPLTLFQIGGHILSSDAMSRIPVSLVHTIKGLSPLFTVLAYRFYFNIRYSNTTYLSLIPLTLGVVMACSANFSGNLIGLICAFGSALLFVTQNIVSKKLFNEAEQAEQDNQPIKRRKPDKLNLLCYSAGLAFIFTAPIWFFSEGIDILGDFLYDASIDLNVKPGSLDHGPLVLEYIFNGTFHFGQNLVAFVLLSMVSPVTYSVASLIKRVFVIVFAIIWFGKPVTQVQAVGFALTFLGLYLYDRTRDNKADQKAKMLHSAKQESLLPISLEKMSDRNTSNTPVQQSSYSNGYVNGFNRDEKKSDDVGPGRPRRESGVGWLPPGTRQEDTWRPGDASHAHEVRVS
ncbi:triose-phosphate transporter family-domain-containing protein [Macrophomina phaseolina]|uniref:Triose-phosphate transporter family-domain-containing protein n=1 Tax=Macrophomina phaseolina TaxID=35725 RepID=A0ABQ8GNL3_9PEZI|nr:triose-phosphate transporter family-domain-containing protein [Macrophomina phaseolina]